MDKILMDWTAYWNQDTFWRDSELWRINAELFFRRIAPILNFQKTDSVLDIGCGPGYLERRLAPLVETVHALDTTEQFVHLCQKNCQDCPNVTAMLLGRNYTDLSLCGRRFSLFLCVSVVQHYKDLSEVEALIRSAQKIALPGARMLIADLPLKRGAPGFVWDAGCSFLLSLKEGYAPIFLKESLSWLRKSWEERSFHKKVRPLYFSKREIQDLIHRLKLQATVITKGLSVYANRPSLLIQF